LVDLTNVSNIALNVLIICLSVLFGGGIIAGAMTWYFKWKKYRDFKCSIWEKDGFGQITETYDKAGIFVDSKTQNKRFFLKKGNVGLNPDNVPYIPAGGKDRIVYLLKTGLKNYYFIKPTIDDTNLKLTVGEEDVNWAINAYERQKKMFSMSMFLQYMPFILLGFTVMIILIIFIYFFKEFGVMKEVAVAFKEAAEALAQARSGTLVMK